MYPRISIVVPIHNGEEYLKKCIDSIIDQTEKNIEIILVENGSTDNSGIICDSYAKQDSRIVVVHQECNGVSFARNTGIELAKGEYIGFVDADDWIDRNMYERLLDKATQTDSDIVMCDATTVYSNGKTQADTITQLSENTILTKSDFTPSLLLEMAGSAWRCIYSKRIYNAKRRKYPLAFPLGVKFSEDRIFNLYAFGYANSVSYVKCSYYNRFMNLKSVVHRFHPDYFEAVKKAHTQTQFAIDRAWSGNKKYKIAYLNQFIIGSFGAINNYYYKTSTLSAKERKNAVKRICNDEELIQAIKYSAFHDIRSGWVMKKRWFLLSFYARLFNLKNNR